MADPDILARSAEGWVLRMPLLIGPHAALVVRGTTLRLSTGDMAAIVSAGILGLVDATVTSLDRATGEPSRIDDDDRFRPFLLGIGGSRILIAGSRLASLGHRGEKAYGLTASSGPAQAGALPPPSLWMVDSRVEDLFYGLYTFEAGSVVVVNNRFSDNIVYGIDPHDFTRGLVIAGNVVERTRRRHGIVLARGVRDAWLVDNVSRGNGGSGLMVDDAGKDVVIARNEIVDNDWDGIALFESDAVLIRDNRIAGNARDGIRIRNSSGVTVVANVVENNGSDGVEVYGSGSADRAGSHALLCHNILTTPGDAAVDVHGSARLDWLRGTGDAVVPLAMLKLRDRAALQPWLATPPAALTVLSAGDGTLQVLKADETRLAGWCERQRSDAGPWRRLPPASG
ncbi:MAG: right-handed parallel beta-helix repeat-containing protein [Geminicoccaceae bacterium]